MRVYHTCYHRRRIRAVALAVNAHAQTAGCDPNQLPADRGELQLFTSTPRGDIDGFILTDGAEVKTPPRLSTQIALIIRPGDDVTARGLKAAKLPLIQAMSVTYDRDGRTVVDKGPEALSANAQGGARENHSVAGQVRMVLHGPLGEINEVLLVDGTILRLPPPDLERFTALLAPGQHHAAEGMARATGRRPASSRSDAWSDL